MRPLRIDRLLIVVAWLLSIAASAAATQPSGPCEARRCAYTVRGGDLDLRMGDGMVSCGSVAGHGQAQSPTTGLLKLRLRGCRERSTPFRFSCREGVDASTMETRVTGSEDHMLTVTMLGWRVRLRCALGIEFLVEGFWVGHPVGGECSRSSGQRHLLMEFLGHGREGSGALFDVYMDETGDTYKTHRPWRINTEVFC